MVIGYWWCLQKVMVFIRAELLQIVMQFKVVKPIKTLALFVLTYFIKATIKIKLYSKVKLDFRLQKRILVLIARVVINQKFHPCSILVLSSFQYSNYCLGLKSSQKAIKAAIEAKQIRKVLFDLNFSFLPKNLSSNSLMIVQVRTAKFLLQIDLQYSIINLASGSRREVPIGSKYQRDLLIVVVIAFLLANLVACFQINLNYKFTT